MFGTINTSRAIDFGRGSSARAGGAITNEAGPQSLDRAAVARVSTSGKGRPGWVCAFFANEAGGFQALGGIPYSGGGFKFTEIGAKQMDTSSHPPCRSHHRVRCEQHEGGQILFAVRSIPGAGVLGDVCGILSLEHTEQVFSREVSLKPGSLLSETQTHSAR